MIRERHAILLIIGLAIVGHVARLLWLRSDEPPGGVVLLDSLPAASPAAQRRVAVHGHRPLTAGAHIDLDTAPAEEVSRLPRVGLALAQAIVADRMAHGPFGSLEAVGRVAGVGEGALKRIEPWVSFSRPTGLPQHLSQSIVLPPDRSPFSHHRQAKPPVHRKRYRNSQDSLRLDRKRALRRLPVSSPGPFNPIDLNAATLAELVALPGIGPGRAAAIVAYRDRHGPFASVNDLVKVYGIHPVLIDRIRDYVSVR